MNGVNVLFNYHWYPGNEPSTPVVGSVDFYPSGIPTKGEQKTDPQTPQYGAPMGPRLRKR